MSAFCGKSYASRTMSDAWTYGAKLREYRQSVGMSQQQAAVAAGVALGTYGGWERGTQNPTDENIKLIAAVLGVDPRDIGYQPPEGWELVPVDWLRDAFKELNTKLDEVRGDLRTLKGKR